MAGLESKASNKRFFLLTGNDYSLEYTVVEAPNSSDYLLTFHGFGLTEESFEVLDVFYQKFNIVGINLFFHGKSKLQADRIDKAYFAEIIQRLLSSLGVEKVSLLAYSMGGKFALSLLEFIPDKIDKAYLIAADGLRINKSYLFATHTLLGKTLTKSFVKNPKPFITTTKVLEKAKVLKPKLAKFVYFYTESAATREKVYQVWHAFKLIKPNLIKVAQNANSSNIHLHLIFGKFDFVIPQKDEKELKALMRRELLSTHIIKCGHNVFKTEVNLELENKIGKSL